MTRNRETILKYYSHQAPISYPLCLSGHSICYEEGLLLKTSPIIYSIPPLIYYFHRYKFLLSMYLKFNLVCVLHLLLIFPEPTLTYPLILGKYVKIQNPFLSFLFCLLVQLISYFITFFCAHSTRAWLHIILQQTFVIFKCCDQHTKGVYENVYRVVELNKDASERALNVIAAQVQGLLHTGG